VRFTAQPEQLVAISEAVAGTKELLRHLLIKLTKVEMENPFRFHEALASKQVETIDEADTEDATPDDESAETTPDEVTDARAADDGEDAK
jgi:hypothetical protein